MIPHAKKLFILTLLLLAVLVSSFGEGQGGGLVNVSVLRVIDGDTMEISDGDRVRLLGIDAPERGDPLSGRATDRLRELIASGSVTLEICEDRDIYGRLLATVRAERINVNRILLREGLALPMLIPPCGGSVAVDVLADAAKAVLSGKGIYSLNGYGIISHIEAGSHIGEHAMVKGKILELHRGRKAWHFNFGPDWNTDFTAVLFRDGKQRFSDLGIDPAVLVGSEVLVIGKVKRYNGPEIIVQGPDQVIPLEGRIIQNDGLEQ
jgi:micrococcal nuclease